MANYLYPKFKQNLLEGSINFDTDVITAYLVDTDDYTYSTAHSLVTSLTGGSGVVASQVLSSHTTTDGTLDVADFTFSTVDGDVAEAIVIGVGTFLVAYYDTGVTGLPVTPNSGAINVTVNASGLFDL
jgi:hypothetical protein